MMHFIVIAVISFLCGSIPFAYIFVKKHHKKDLRNEGSGNIGMLNAYEVTGSKNTGKMVLLFDALKAILPMVAIKLIYGSAFPEAAVALFFIVLGHNFSPWIGFKGGRGLAPAAGGALAFNPFLPLGWGIIWYITYRITKSIHWGNIVATVALPLIVWIVPHIFTLANVHQTEENHVLTFASVGICGLIFVKHLVPLRDLLIGNAKT